MMNLRYHNARFSNLRKSSLPIRYNHPSFWALKWSVELKELKRWMEYIGLLAIAIQDARRRVTRLILLSSSRRLVKGI